MIYLIKYHRPTQRVQHFEAFTDAERDHAREKRLRAELDLGDDRLDYEVLILDSDSEATLRRTHARYFEPFDPLGELGAASRSSS